MATAPNEVELRRRLEEAEETLRAIREGEVDALVVRRGTAEDAVFALDGQDSYRGFMEAMDIGAAAIDIDRKLVYANSALCALLGRSAKALQEEGLFAALGPVSSRTVEQLIEQASNSRRSRQVALACPGGFCHVEVSVAPMSLGFGQGYALTFTDVTERIETAAAHESERIGRAIMASSNEAVLVCSRDGVITHANAGVRPLHEGSTVGKRFEDAFPLSFALSSGLLNAADLIGVAVAGGAIRGVEATLVDGRIRELLLSASPLRQSGETIGGCIVTLTDVTDRKTNEKRQALLMGELTHRVKNTLTLVLSIANRTIAGARDLPDFRTAFARRIEALAATHTLLAEGAWDGLTLEDLIGAELAPYVTLGSDRVALSGLDIRVAPDTGVALGLIFHELVTNAVKYGALSNETGRISITASERDDRAVEIVWQEDGGPTVAPPNRTGFGQTVIARGLGQVGEHATKVEFRPAGLVCRMYVPVEAILAG